MHYVSIAGVDYPVHYIHEDRNWAWKKPNWIGDLSIIDDDVFINAEQLEERCKELDSISGNTYLKQFYADVYAKEMQYNWAIEGEHLNSDKLRSQLIKQLCLDIPEWIPHKELVRDERENRAVQAALFLINSQKAISIDDIVNTHKLLATHISDSDYGKIRTCHEIVGRISKDRTKYEIIFEAPEAENVYPLLEEYITWWKNSINLPKPLGAALAQLYFVEIHPFHDGNGRMARLLTDKYLINTPQESFRPYSMSAVIRTHRSDNKDTLIENSARTGASLPKLEGKLEDLSLPNISREPLVPYICTSLSILGKPSSYYKSIDQYSHGYNINNYLYYMLSTQTFAVEGAIKRAPLLHDLHEFFQETKEYLNNNERSIIKNSYLTDALFVERDDAIVDIPDEEEAIKSWNILQESNLLKKNGKCVLSIEAAKKLYNLKNNDVEHNQEQDFSQSM